MPDYADDYDLTIDDLDAIIAIMEENEAKERKVIRKGKRIDIVEAPPDSSFYKRRTVYFVPIRKRGKKKR